MIPFLQGQDHFDIIVIVFLAPPYKKKYSKMICPNHERNPTLFWSLLILDMSRTPKWTGDSEASHQMGRTWRGVASSLPSGKRLEKTNWKDPPCLMSKST